MLFLQLWIILTEMRNCWNLSRSSPFKNVLYLVEWSVKRTTLNFSMVFSPGVLWTDSYSKEQFIMIWKQNILINSINVLQENKVSIQDIKKKTLIRICVCLADSAMTQKLSALVCVVCVKLRINPWWKSSEYNLYKITYHGSLFHSKVEHSLNCQNRYAGTRIKRGVHIP